jgi:hypothetical protein
MSKNIHWHIGKEGALSSRLDVGPFRAYFYWTTDGMLEAAADYSVQELETEIC